MNLLTIENLSLSYDTQRGRVHAVDGASMTVKVGEVVGLVGESGCGKTSLARAITGVIPRNASIDGGAIVWNGVDLLALDEAAHVGYRWKEFSFVPQSAMNALNPVLRVVDQLVEILVQRSALNKGQAQRRAVELVDMVGIERARLRDYPHQFSGGMRQRIAIAMALALNPKLLIADEPVTALDVIVQRQVLDVIRQLQTRLQLSMIIVTHDISVVAYVCDSVVVMYAGNVIESGRTGEVLQEPLHPYTMGLTHAFPDLEKSRGELLPIEGSPPDLISPPKGCRFAERCQFAQPICRDTAPSMVAVENGRQVACWRHKEASLLRSQYGRTAACTA